MSKYGSFILYPSFQFFRYIIKPFCVYVNIYCVLAHGILPRKLVKLYKRWAKPEPRKRKNSKAQVIERYVGGKGEHKQDTGVRLCQKRKSKIFRQLFAKLFCCGMSECRAAILRHRL